MTVSVAKCASFDNLQLSMELINGTLSHCCELKMVETEHYFLCKRGLGSMGRVIRKLSSLTIEPSLLLRGIK